MNLLPLKAFNCFNILVLISSVIDKDHYLLYDPDILIFFQIVLTVKDNSRSTLSAGKTRIDVSDFNSSKALRSSLEGLSLGGLKF